MHKSRKAWIFGVVVAAALVAGLQLNAASSNSDAVRIAAVVNQMHDLGFAKIDQLTPVAVQPYTLPGPSVDVMRVRLQETYNVAGVGDDTVELSGWIAVRHGASRPAPGEHNVSWSTAVTDTEFVGLELHGQSAIFGPVNVVLDGARPAIGQVGKIAVPEYANQILLAANKEQKAQPAPKTQSGPTVKPDAAAACNCRAPVNVKVSMPNLGLEMKTKQPAVWYSQVTTIPPVGHVASVTAEPVALVSADREVGTLVSGVVKFREVVRTDRLSPDHQIVVASLGGQPAR